MKSIEQCLDITLYQLEKNWTLKGRRPLQVQDLLESFGLPERHEFLISIIDKLILDGYASLMDRTSQDIEMIDYYKWRSLITVKGYYFVRNKKTYVRNKRWDTAISVGKFFTPILISAIISGVGVWYTISRDSKKDKQEEQIGEIQKSMQKLDSVPLRLDQYIHQQKRMEGELKVLTDTIKALSHR